MKIVGYLLCCIVQRQCNSSVHIICGICQESTAANTHKAHSFMPVTGLYTLDVTGTDLRKSMPIYVSDSGRGCTREVMGLKDKVEIGAKLDSLSVGIVRRWLLSDSGMCCAITQY